MNCEYDAFIKSLRPTAFVMSEDSSSIPDNFKKEKFINWTIGYSGALSLTKPNIAGYNGAILIAVVNQADLDKRNFLNVESLEEQLIGGFIVILNNNGNIEIRSDACGMLPVVFSSKDRIIASCPSLIKEQEYCPRYCSLIRDRDTFFPFGLTAKPGVRRLLPNHALSLDSFDDSRYWDIRNISQEVSANDLIDEIIDKLRSILFELHERAPLCIPLTAGRDSRALVACSAGLPNIRTFTNVLDDYAEWDNKIAKQVAEYLRLNHSSQQFIGPDSIQREMWLERIGYSVGGRASFGFLTSPRDTEAWLVSGLCGEVGRNTYPAFDSRPEPRDVLKFLNVENSSAFQDAAERWLQPLEGLDGRQLADLLYLEIRLGCWAGPQLSCPGVNLAKVAPFGNRRIVNNMLKIPERIRRKKRVLHEIIGRADPKLLSFRFSQSGKREFARVNLARAGLYSIARKI